MGLRVQKKNKRVYKACVNFPFILIMCFYVVKSVNSINCLHYVFCSLIMQEICQAQVLPHCYDATAVFIILYFYVHSH
jgi:hypothetical protein